MANCKTVYAQLPWRSVAPTMAARPSRAAYTIADLVAGGDTGPDLPGRGIAAQRGTAEHPATGGRRGETKTEAFPGTARAGPGKALAPPRAATRQSK